MWTARLRDGLGGVRQRLADLRRDIEQRHAASPAAEPIDRRESAQQTPRERVAYELTRWDASLTRRPRVLVTALGPAEDEIEQETLIESACTIALGDGLFPVVVASGLSVEFLVRAARPIEQLPKRTDLALLDDAEYRYYLQQRWRILLAKWNISETIDLLLTFDEFVSSP